MYVGHKKHACTHTHTLHCALTAPVYVSFVIMGLLGDTILGASVEILTTESKVLSGIFFQDDDMKQLFGA